MQRAERAVGQVLQADEFDMHEGLRVKKPTPCPSLKGGES
jgi:hypothetical protein